MSLWSTSVEKFSSSTQSTKVAIVAVAASVTTAAVMLGYQGSQRKRRSRKLKDDLASPLSRSTLVVEDPKQSAHQDHHSHHHHHHVQQHHHHHIQRDGVKAPFDEELIQEQLARNIAFLGEEGVQKLRESFVVIVGAGLLI
jgi:hypothetical protein